MDNKDEPTKVTLTTSTTRAPVRPLLASSLAYGYGMGLGYRPYR